MRSIGKVYICGGNGMSSTMKVDFAAGVPSTPKGCNF